MEPAVEYDELEALIVPKDSFYAVSAEIDVSEPGCNGDDSDVVDQFAVVHVNRGSDLDDPVRERSAHRWP